METIEKKHIFVIVRLDHPFDSNSFLSRLSGTKAYFDEGEAEAEAECKRLQDLRPDKESEYVVVLARLVPLED